MKRTAKYALAASMTAGIRSIFCYTPTLCVKSWQPRLTLSLGMLQPWHFDQISQFAALLANHPRISLGFGFDGFAFTPENVIRSLFDKLRAAEVLIITSHLLRTPSDASHKSIIATMAELDILDENTIISHATNATLQDNELLARHGASISCTPSCEMHLGLGQPAIMSQFNQNESRNENLDREIHFSLGCDSHSVVKGSMIEQMRSALFASRMQQTQSLLQKDKFPRAPEPTVEEVFQLATSSGARAIGRENELGRLEVGYKADIVVWDGQGPSMVSAATENPLAAVVCHADAKDIDYVIVDGIIRKQNGNLVDCKMQGYDENLLNEKYFPKKDDLCWVDVAEALEQSHAVLQERLIQSYTPACHVEEGKKGEGMDRGIEALIDALGLDRNGLAD